MQKVYNIESLNTLISNEQANSEPNAVEKNRAKMTKLISYRMPFGKYKNVRLVDLPEPYVVWFSKNGFPSGELGEMLSIVHEIKVNGLEYLFKR